MRPYCLAIRVARVQHPPVLQPAISIAATYSPLEATLTTEDLTARVDAELQRVLAARDMALYKMMAHHPFQIPPIILFPERC